MTFTDTSVTSEETRTPGFDLVRASTWCGIAFTVCQLAVMVFLAIFVLPQGGSPSDPAIERGQRAVDAAELYRVGNYVFMVAGVLMLGFLGAISVRLKRIDATGTLATVAVAAGTLIALVWPYSGVLQDVALEAAEAGTDVRILAGWDAVAPYSLAFSVFPRIFLVVAIVVALRIAGESPWLQRSGIAIAVVSFAGSTTLLSATVFPVLALSSLAFELWIAALAWHWLRTDRLSTRPAA